MTQKPSITNKAGPKLPSIFIAANFTIFSVFLIQLFNSLSSTSGRVNNGRHFISCSNDGSGFGRSLLDDIGPGQGRSRILWTHRKCDRVKASGDTSFHYIPRFLVELSNENHFGFGMIQNVPSCFGSKGWINLRLRYKQSVRKIDWCIGPNESIGTQTKSVH